MRCFETFFKKFIILKMISFSLAIYLAYLILALSFWNIRIVDPVVSSQFRKGLLLPRIETNIFPSFLYNYLDSEFSNFFMPYYLIDKKIKKINNQKEIDISFLPANVLPFKFVKNNPSIFDIFLRIAFYLLPIFIFGALFYILIEIIKNTMTKIFIKNIQTSIMCSFLFTILIHIKCFLNFDITTIFNTITTFMVISVLNYLIFLIIDNFKFKNIFICSSKNE